MHLNEYQQAAMSTAVYPGIGANHLLYPALKLAGEAGEVAEKVGKKMRAQGTTTVQTSQFSREERVGLAKELGDVLWYVAALADALGYSLEQVAVMNNEKLASREERNVLIGEGDDR